MGAKSKDPENASSENGATRHSHETRATALYYEGSDFLDRRLTQSLQPGAPDCQTLFLDAGGVLVWPNWWRIAQVLRDHGIEVAADSLASADPIVRKSLDAPRQIAGLIDQQRSSKYYEMLLSQSGVELPLSQGAESALADLRHYHATENLWEYVPDFVRPALIELRGLGLKLVVVSNANGTLVRAFHRVGLAPLVDVMLDSQEVGFEKPDRRLFDTALEQSGADRATTIHVGDFYNIDVIGARNAGLRAILVDQAGLYADADCPRIASIAELPALFRRTGKQAAADSRG
jgi:HAD superfamily hydrolase (TIGR01549 family)